jgi:hypothetical protein
MTARWLSVLLMAAMSMPGWAQSQPQEHFALTAAQVARALSDSGIPTSDSQVSLLTRVVATEPDPALNVVSVEAISKEPLAGHSAAGSRVKLACRLPNYCLPFFVTVSWSQPPAGPAGSMSTNPSLDRNMLTSPNSQFTMRAGTRATLVIDDQRSHIQVAVISLQNGMAGHRIRVSSPDHKQVYFGEVVSANLLKGSF